MSIPTQDDIDHDLEVYAQSLGMTVEQVKRDMGQIIDGIPVPIGDSVLTTGCGADDGIYKVVKPRVSLSLWQRIKRFFRREA